MQPEIRGLRIPTVAWPLLQAEAYIHGAKSTSSLIIFLETEAIEDRELRPLDVDQAIVQTTRRSISSYPTNPNFSRGRLKGQTSPCTVWCRPRGAPTRIYRAIYEQSKLAHACSAILWKLRSIDDIIAVQPGHKQAPRDQGP